MRLVLTSGGLVSDSWPLISSKSTGDHAGHGEQHGTTPEADETGQEHSNGAGSARGKLVLVR